MHAERFLYAITHAAPGANYQCVKMSLIKLRRSGHSAANRPGMSTIRQVDIESVLWRTAREKAMMAAAAAMPCRR